MMVDFGLLSASLVLFLALAGLMVLVFEHDATGARGYAEGSRSDCGEARDEGGRSDDFESLTAPDARLGERADKAAQRGGGFGEGCGMDGLWSVLPLPVGMFRASTTPTTQLARDLRPCASAETASGRTSDGFRSEAGREERSPGPYGCPGTDDAA